MGEVNHSMTEDLKMASNSIHSDKLVLGRTRRASIRIISCAVNADKVIQFASTHPIALQGALMRHMKNTSRDIDHFVQLHTINRALIASEPNSGTYLTTKWTNYMVVKVPTSRIDLLGKVKYWWPAS